MKGYAYKGVIAHAAKEMEMEDRDVVINYLDDLRLDPKYYQVKRSYFIEMSWMHWAEEEIIDLLNEFPDIDPLIIVQGFKNESLENMGRAKTRKGKDIFRTAYYLAMDVEELLIAMKGE